MKVQLTKPDEKNQAVIADAILKVQLSKTRELDDALTVYFEHGPEVDLVTDPRYPYGLKFRQNSVDVIYDFRLLLQTETKHIAPTLKNWFDALAPGGQLYILEPDFEYICRAVVSGDLSLKEFNQDLIAKSYLNRDMIVSHLLAAGFPTEKQIEWYDSSGLKIQKKRSDVLICATKPLK